MALAHQLDCDLSITESQLEELNKRWSQIIDSQEFDDTDELTPPSAPAGNPEFQSEYVRSLSADYGIEPIQSDPKTKSIPNEDALNRTIADFETKLPTYITSAANAVQPFCRDFETFLETGVVTIKPNASCVYRTNARKTHAPNYTTTPMPFLITDVQKIDLNGGFNTDLSMYGQNFKSVMIHGFSTPVNARVHEEKGSKYFNVDDGTGRIRIKFNYGTHQKDLRQKVEILRRDFFIARKEGILGAEGKLLPPQSDECKTMLKHVETVLGCIDRNMKKAHETIPFGGKLFVQGLPFWHERCKENQLYAFNIYHDSGTNRDMEISFKRSLLRLYETRYLKFTADGKPVQ